MFMCFGLQILRRTLVCPKSPVNQPISCFSRRVSCSWRPLTRLHSKTRYLWRGDARSTPWLADMAGTAMTCRRLPSPRRRRWLLGRYLLWRGPLSRAPFQGPRRLPCRCWSLKSSCHPFLLQQTDSWLPAVTRILLLSMKNLLDLERQKTCPAMLRMLSMRPKLRPSGLSCRLLRLDSLIRF